MLAVVFQSMITQVKLRAIDVQPQAMARRDIKQTAQVGLCILRVVSTLSTVPISVYQYVRALLCTAGSERLFCSSFETKRGILLEVYQSPPFLYFSRSLSSGHGKGNCGETLPQIDSLNMEGFSQEKMHDRILGLFTKQLL